MKCEACKVELFDIDIVEWKDDKQGMIMSPYKYRCPKCFKITKKVEKK